MIEVSSFSITEVKKSKFISYIVPISEFEGLQARLKKENPKANHVVYALRYLNEFDQIVENSSDDGEPKGCAGLPVLNVLRGMDIINCAVVIVRYFGGIKLGTGGMVRAYTQSVKDVLSSTSFMVYKKQKSITFATSYSDIGKIEYQLNQLDLIISKRDFMVDKVVWVVKGNEENIRVLQLS